MQVLIGAFATQLLWVLGKFIGRVIFGLGLGVVAYQGVDVLVGALQTKISEVLGGVDQTYSVYLSAFGFQTALSIITAAWLARVGTQVAYKFAMRRAAT